ncbi:MAG: glycosyltransferase [Candidatus Competibacter sp.]|nr:glycosyltransferase [Candidatus Competibacter sp.]MDG4582713.1 glycosyltransferase [Candidatus Competibacter sp.]
MRVLVIAYEFPPIIAAQSLRWFYLTQELARIGVEVHVLCPSFPALEGLHPVIFEPGIVLHRVWPGPFVGLSQWLVRATRSNAITGASDTGNIQPFFLRSYRLTRKLLDHLLFPDLRTEWYPFARRRLHRLLIDYRFDAMISSHEPGVDLLLGLWAQKQFKVKWIADLGDPILTPYSPGWRRKIDTQFESRILRQADSVLLTNDWVKRLLCDRHRFTDVSNKLICIPQGFPEHLPFGHSETSLLSTGVMNIVFTGTFYRDFRSPLQFALALRDMNADDIMMTAIGDNLDFIPIFKDISNIRFLGKINHFECLAAQREADLLLNIGNLQSYQVPGKIFEYLGAAKPILHIKTSEDDIGANLVQELNAGLVVKNDRIAIKTGLQHLLELWRNHRLTQSFPPNFAAIAQYSWSARAKDLLQLLTR